MKDLMKSAMTNAKMAKNINKINKIKKELSKKHYKKHHNGITLIMDGTKKFITCTGSDEKDTIRLNELIATIMILNEHINKDINEKTLSLLK